MLRTKYKDIWYVFYIANAILSRVIWFFSVNGDAARNRIGWEKSSGRSVRVLQLDLTKIMRKDAGFARNREPFCRRSEEWKSLSASRSAFTSNHWYHSISFFANRLEEAIRRVRHKMLDVTIRWVRYYLTFSPILVFYTLLCNTFLCRYLEIIPCVLHISYYLLFTIFYNQYSNVLSLFLLII